MIDVYRSTNGTNFTNITNGYAGGNVHVDQHYLFFIRHKKILLLYVMMVEFGTAETMAIHLLI